ncbi:FkbM family methyltransferase [Dyella sp. ASV21]|uniref:FkbM family methyltransferase n=1 Tax=Dyella sp. ASV21 TaxID=2795114 RepID=UPI0018EDEFEE|nr:FkbM family methyltransferase [Dyella sp. ASV21]
MNIVSYAQNQEDVMLHRALRDVVHGFYIDVGAQQPVLDSVTKLFYDMGWTGINIDPMPQWVEMLKADRPHDINLQLAVSDRAGRMTFFAIPGTGLSTADQDFARRHESAGYVAHEITVEVRTLDDICEEHGVREVHFLKIDVEGAEEGVIRGFSFERIRPWIVVVEAVEPVAQREGEGALDAVMSHAAWDPLLLARGYEFVYWDGLNRFYLASEHAELRERFSAPPNPLDAFVRHNDLVKHERIIQLEVERRGLVDAGDLVAQRRELGDIHGLVETAQNRLQRIAELEQDNARLVGRANAFEEQLQGAVSELKQELSRMGGLTVALDSAHAQIRSVEARLKQEQAWARAAEAQFKQGQAKIREAEASLDEEKERAAKAILRAQQAQYLSEQVELLRAQRDQYAASLQVILSSRSWRITKPVRWISSRFERHPAAKGVEGGKTLRGLPRRAVRRALFAGARFLQRHQGIRDWASGVLERSPRLKHRLKSFHRHNASYIYSEVDVVSAGSGFPIVEGAPTSGVDLIHARLSTMVSSKRQSSIHD